MPGIRQSVLPPSLRGAAPVRRMLHQRVLLLRQHEPRARQQDGKWRGWVSNTFPLFIFLHAAPKTRLTCPPPCQLMKLSPPRMERSVHTVTFVNHTSCECFSKRPLHSIIRRAAADHL